MVPSTAPSLLSHKAFEESHLKDSVFKCQSQGHNLSLDLTIAILCNQIKAFLICHYVPLQDVLVNAISKQPLAQYQTLGWIPRVNIISSRLRFHPTPVLAGGFHFIHVASKCPQGTTQWQVQLNSIIHEYSAYFFFFLITSQLVQEGKLRGGTKSSKNVLAFLMNRDLKESMRNLGVSVS